MNNKKSSEGADKPPHYSFIVYLVHFRCKAVTVIKDVVKNTSVIFNALNDSQQIVKIKWHSSRLMILRGIPGGGKTFIALAMALTDIKNKSVSKLMVARPAVECGETLGFLPGTLDDKILPWMGPISDVISDMSYAKLEDFPIEMVSCGMLRGRTVKNATLIVDEAQNLSYAQLKCIVTRILPRR